MRPGRAALAALLLLTGLGLTACGEDTTPLATASPNSSDAPAGPNILPAPAGPAATTDTSPAGMALAAAAKKTSEAGSFRVKLSATFKGVGSGPSGTMAGSGETESHTRFHLLLSFVTGTQQLTTETITYDGVTYGRSTTQPWHVVAAATPSDPRSYLGYLSGASAVHDAGPGTHDGQPAERYEAAVDLTRRSGSSPAPAAPRAPVALGTLVAWVDLASGRLTGEDLSSAPTSTQPTVLSISFQDFGTAIRVVPPTASP